MQAHDNSQNITKYAWSPALSGQVVTTRPYCLPVTLEEVKQNIRLETDETGQDGMILGYIAAATSLIEQYQRRTLIKTSRKQINDQWLPEFNPIYPPLISVTTIKYLDTDGDQQTLASDQYVVDTTTEPGRINRAPHVSWPTLYGQAGQIEIQYDAGYPEIIGASTGALTGATTAIVADGITVAPPTSGVIYLKNAVGQAETINYQTYYANSGTYTFTVDKTLDYVYAEDDVVTILTVPHTTRMAIVAMAVHLYEHPNTKSEVLLYNNGPINLMADIEALEGV